MNEAVNRLLHRASDEDSARREGRYRIEPREVGFGFDIARARELVTELGDEQLLAKLEELFM